jgi:predicted RNA polymerase sigma factor
MAQVVGEAMSTESGAVETIWRIEAGRLIAGLARFTSDLGVAEELAQDAFVVALEQWPVSGIPPNPGGWLMTTAKRRAIDQFRREAVHRKAVVALGTQPIPAETDRPDAVIDEGDDPIGDDLLRLIFTACHPVLPREARAALVLRCVAGLRTDEIARAFLLTEPQAGQRISRAKKALRDKHIRFELPDPEALALRVGSVLEVVYLVFNEGWSATAGDDLQRPALIDEAVRLSRLMSELVPDVADVHGLQALLELTAARRHTRTDSAGRPVLLADQDRTRWDRLLIRRGLAALDRAHTGAGPVGPYTVQAAIAACHVRAGTAADTDWARIVELYDVLVQVWPSPVVELNRAVALAQADGPAAGLAALDARIPPGTLTHYALLAAARGDFLRRLGHTAAAVAAFTEAAGLTRNDAERDQYLRRAGELGAGPSSP